MTLCYGEKSKFPQLYILQKFFDVTYYLLTLFLYGLIAIYFIQRFFAAGTCANIAGSGNEACRNNSYPRSASFAQPSGVAYCFERDELLIADSESSSVRCINMKTGKVSSVVGGSKIPDVS